MSRERALRKHALAKAEEALEQQTASNGVLEVISKSPSDLSPVFDAILASATRLCDAQLGLLNFWDGENCRTVSQRGGNPEFAKWVLGGGAFKPDPATSLARVIEEREPIQVLDLKEAAAFRAGVPRSLKLVELGGARTHLIVPLVKEERVLGMIGIYRSEVRAFSTKQIELVKTFANQAVIAIENARLFNETKEALERQTATAEILKVISNSPTATQPVFESIVQKCHALYLDSRVALRLIDDGWLVTRASTEAGAFEPMPIDRESGLGWCVLEARTIHLPDLEAAAEQYPRLRQLGLRHGYRSGIFAPLLREGRAIGGISVLRRQPGAFSDKDVALLTTFADQAVIAIENVRLFNETKEALERQTATGEILASMSGSMTDTKPVFDAIVRNLLRLFGSNYAAVLLRRDQVFELAGFKGEPGFERLQEAFPSPLDEHTISGEVVMARQVRRYTPIAGNLAVPRRTAEFAGRFGFNSIMAAPMMWKGEAIGAIVTSRRQPLPFDDKQVALIQSFADQAVIAIENARLFNETKEALERQTATSELLKMIERSAFDLQPVFETLAESVVRLCHAERGFILRFDGQLLRGVASYNASAELIAFIEQHPIAPGRQTASGRAALERRTIHVTDAMSDPDYSYGGQQVDYYRTLLAVPMLRGDALLGVIVIYRHVVLPFTAGQIALVETFADQAAIAIENVRLFKELQERTEALTKSVGQLTALGEVGQAISSTLDLDKVLKTIVSRAVQLAGLDGGSIYEFDDRDEGFHLRAAEHVEEEILEVSRRSPIRLGEGAVGRAGATREPVVVEDVLDESYQSRVRELLIKSGSRALLAVPLLREDLLLGALVVSRNSPGPFAPEVIDLLKTFATQSAVAIQNARLFNETNEALEQQKASAEVLGAISSSIADTRPVFDKILESCERLFEGHLVGVTLVTPDGKIELGAYHGPDYEKLNSVYPLPLSQESGSGTAILKGVVGKYPDTEAPGVPAGVAAGCRTVGMRSIVFAPMLFEGRGIGAIWVGRKYTGAFSDKQIGLLKTFADQAVIAIQNARLFREIQEKSAQLEVANKHKSDFLANMSHELRTPLNAIIGFSEALMDRMFGDLNEKQLEYQKDIHESGKHLLSLINDILDLSKIEAGRMELELSNFHLPTAISNAVTLIRERAMRHGIALGVEIDQQLGEFQADERKVKQVLLNLLSNAVKFTPDGGRVDVSAKLDTDKVEISVRDTGVGIAPDDQASLFEEFKQLGKDSSRKAEGTGLGLALSKRLVELHGGQIAVSSAVGQGSLFRVTLPGRRPVTK